MQVHPVPEGCIGQEDSLRHIAPIEPGNTLPLSEIPEGIPICNVESQPGHGGQFARSSGVCAILVAHGDVGQTVVQLPSGR